MMVERKLSQHAKTVLELHKVVRLELVETPHFLRNESEYQVIVVIGPVTILASI